MPLRFFLHLFTFHQREFRRAKPTDPKTYELVVNYRSHGGIVNCARSVIELITLYWPQSIDILQPERASVDGFRPIFFSSQGNVNPLPAPLLSYPVDLSADRMTLRDLSSAMAKRSRLTSGQTSVNAQLLVLAFTGFTYRTERRHSCS